MNEEMQMNLRKSCVLARKALVGLSMCCPLLCPDSCSPLHFYSPKRNPPTSSPPTQQTFKSPNEAAEALIRAAETNDVPALKQILGADGEDLVASEDAVQDKNIAIAFAAEAHQKTSIAIDPEKTGPGHSCRRK